MFLSKSTSKSTALTIAFFLLIIPSILALDACSDFINKLQRNNGNPDAQSYDEKIYFAFSARRGRNDLGHRKDCESSSDRRYYIIGEIISAPKEIHSKSYAETETGICVPEYCTPKILESNPSYLVKLARLNNWNTRGKLVLYDPNAEPPRSQAYYILVSIFYILVALCLISTFVGAFKKSPHDSHWVFKSFDMSATFESLISTAKESGQTDHLSMFGFVRIASIIWIVAFHTMIIHRQINLPQLSGSSNTLLERFIKQGDMGPELFFFMAGFLAAFTLVSKATKQGTGICNFLSDCWHRYLRTYPGFIVSMLFFWIVMPGLMNGPLWNRYLGVLPVCEERLSQKLLLTANFEFQQFTVCAAWSWYVFTDLHVYPVVILLAYVYTIKKVPKIITYIIVIILTVFSFKMGIDILNTKSNIPARAMHRWYNFSPARAGHILVGVFFGFQYYEYSKLKLKSNFIAICERYAVIRYLSMIIGCYLSWISMFTIPEKGTEDKWEFQRRYILSIAVALIFSPLANDGFSILKKIMNLRFFQILGKLSFGIFLFHWTILVAINYTDDNIPHVFDFNAVLLKTFKVFMYSLAVAIVYHFLFEKPLLNIEAHFKKVKAPKSAAQVSSSTGNKDYMVIPGIDVKDSTVQKESVIDLGDTNETGIIEIENEGE